MDTKELVNIWDIRDKMGYADLSDDTYTKATIGLHWATAGGPVNPETARRFARRILRVADEVEQRKQNAKNIGCIMRDPEKIR